MVSSNSIHRTLLPRSRTLTSNVPLSDSGTVVANESDRRTTRCRCHHRSWISDLFSTDPIPKPCRQKDMTKAKFCGKLIICDGCYNGIRALARKLYRGYNLDKEPSLVPRKRSDNHSNAIISLQSVFKCLMGEDDWPSEWLYFDIRVQKKRDQRRSAKNLSQINQAPEKIPSAENGPLGPETAAAINGLLELHKQDRRAPEHCSVGTFDFKSLMDNPDDVFRCLEIARTRCLCVWGLVSEDQVKRYYREWRSGEGPADEAALLLLLVALGARYIVCGGPTCSQADGLFMEAQKLLPMTGDTHTSAAGLLAAYVMTLYRYHFLEEDGKRSSIGFTDCVGAYLSLKAYLNIVFSWSKESPQRSDEEYMESRVIVAILYLFFDIASKVTKRAEMSQLYPGVEERFRVREDGLFSKAFELLQLTARVAKELFVSSTARWTWEYEGLNARVEAFQIPCDAADVSLQFLHLWRKRVSILVMLVVNKPYVLKKSCEIRETIYQLITTVNPAGLLFEHFVGCYRYVYDQFCEEDAQSEWSTEQNLKISKWVYEEQAKGIEEKFWDSDEFKVAPEKVCCSDSIFDTMRQLTKRDFVYETIEWF